MKKSSKPSIKSPAPATASPAPLPKLASKPATKISAEPAPAAAAPAAAPKPAPRAFASSAPAPKAPAVPVSRIAPVLAAPRPAAASLTVINAKVDVGFGNSLFVRGEGPGLSWSKGLPMTNVGSELWTLSLGPLRQAGRLQVSPERRDLEQRRGLPGRVRDRIDRQSRVLIRSAGQSGLSSRRRAASLGTAASGSAIHEAGASSQCTSTRDQGAGR